MTHVRPVRERRAAALAAALALLAVPACDAGEPQSAAEASTPAGRSAPAAAAPSPAPSRPAPADATPAPEPGPVADAAPRTPAEPAVIDPSAPRLELASGEPHHNFGKLVQGAVAEHVFELVTRGEQDLRIHEIKTSCGCTVAETRVLESEGASRPYTLGTFLPPGTRLAVHAEIDTQAKRGIFRTHLTIRSSDPRGPLQLDLGASVDPFLVLVPPTLSFGTIRANDERTGEMLVTSPIAERFGLRVATESLPVGVAVDLRPIDADADGRAPRWKAGVTVGPGVTVDLPRHVPIRFVADLDDGATGDAAAAVARGENEATGFVMVEVLKPITVTPGYLAFGLLTPGKESTRTLVFEVTDGSDWVLADEVSYAALEGGPFAHADALSHRVVEVEPGRRYELVVTLTGPELEGTVRGSLVVPTGREDQPRVEVPLTAVVRGWDPTRAAQSSDDGS